MENEFKIKDGIDANLITHADILFIKGDLYVNELNPELLHEDGILIEVEGEVIAIFGDTNLIKSDSVYIDLTKVKVKNITTFAKM